jgi:hypothetical protein
VARRSNLRSVVPFALVGLLAAACGADTTTSPASLLDAPSLRALVAAAPVPVTSSAAGLVARSPGGALRVELGADAASPTRVVASPGGAVSVRRVGASPGPVRLDRGAAVIEDAPADVTSLVFATARGVEELAIVDRPGARVAYDLELPAGWAAVRAAVPGLVEVRDAKRTARLRLWASRAWDAAGRDVPVEPVVEGGRRVRFDFDPARVGAWPLAIDPEWTPATDLTVARYRHTATPLYDGRVLLAGGDASKLGLAEVFDPSTGTFTSVGPMTRRRAAHTATLLPGGRVLIAGGSASSAPTMVADDVAASTEIFDPATGAFTAAAPLSGPRAFHTATLLPDGVVVVAGGLDAKGVARADAETLDATTLASKGAPFALASVRAGHAAVLLPGGELLLGGGGAATPTFERCDVAARSCAPLAVGAGSMPDATLTLLPSGAVAYGLVDVLVLDAGAGTAGTSSKATGLAATATLLPSGRVLYAGGSSANYGYRPTVASTVLFDPVSGSSAPAADLAHARSLATATLLPSAHVLVAGGFSYATGAATSSVELIDPEGPGVESVGAMLSPRTHHTMTRLPSGDVLVAGGEFEPFGARGAEIYDPVRQSFRPGPAMVLPRARHTASTLADGRVLVAGGYSADTPSFSLDLAEIFDPQRRVFAKAPSLVAARTGHAAATRPDGTILFAAGGGLDELRAADGTATTFSTPFAYLLRVTATPLEDGRVLVTGGRDPQNLAPPSRAAVLFTGKGYEPLPDLAEPRAEHAAVRLPDGSVLVLGGSRSVVHETDPTATVERFDPAKGTFSPMPPMTRPRSEHTATLLADGDAVLVAGGDDSAELFDVATQSFTALKVGLPEGMAGHAAVTLADGRVLLTGGVKSDGTSTAAVLFDPTKRAFVDGKAHARSMHTATALPDGRVLLAGGVTSDLPFATSATELYDPRTDTFAASGSLAASRVGHTATHVGGGRVVVAGGASGSSDPAKLRGGVELFAKGAFTAAATLSVARAYHAATRLADGAVLVTGG